MHGNMSQKQFCMEIYKKNAAAQNSGPHFLPASAVEMHVDMSQEPLCGNLQEKVPQPRDVTQIVPAQDVKKKHSCETSFKNGSGRCESTLSCEASLKKVKLASVTKKL